MPIDDRMVTWVPVNPEADGGQNRSRIDGRMVTWAPIKEESSLMSNINNLLAGGLRGAGSIGATIARPFESGAENEQRRARLDENARNILGADTDSWMYKGGKLGGEIAGTAGVGGLVARGATAIPYLAQNAAPLLEAIGSGGMALRNTALTPTNAMAVRMAGGAVAGGAAAGMVDPKEAAMGAGIGAALPPGLSGLGVAWGKAADTAAGMFLSQQAAMARKVADIAGAKTREAIQSLRDQLTAPRSSNIGVELTTPQILQNAGISQLQRSVQNAGDASVDTAVRRQNAAMLAALNRISPAARTVQDAAQDAGIAISRFAKDGEQEASKHVSSLYGAVDPFKETRFNLPIDAMQEQVKKYLGPGTYGMGESANKAMSVARQIGMETLEAIKPAAAGKELTLLDTVKRAGGINQHSPSSQQLAGELKGLKQQGLGRVVGKSGQSVDRMAEDMFQRGFIHDDDPVTLLNALREGGGDYATGGGAKSMQSAYEGAMGDAPEAERILKAIPFDQLQNFRSSLASDIAKLKVAPGNKSEYAALVGMKKNIDDAVDNVANGGGAPGEYFPADIAATWREAGAAHAAKKARFNTGPQAAIFRTGADGQAAVQGGEVPRQFFNSLRSQTDDMAAFQRLVEGDQGPVNALKNYAVTSAVGTQSRLGNLTNAQFNNWANAHSGAIKGLFDAPDQAVFSEIGKHLKLADLADSLNIAKGSNTIQNVNAAMSNGLLDNPITSFIANRMPVLKHFAGPVLDGLKQSTKQARAAQLGGLLADPALLDESLQQYLRLKSAGGLLNFMPDASPLLYRAAPILGTSQ